MTTYHLDTAFALRVHALLMWAAGATLAAIGLVHVSSGDDQESGFTFVVVALFIGGCVWGGIAKLREASEIRLLEDGMVEVARGFGGTRFGPGDIYRLEGTLKQEYTGGPTWDLRIHHAGGRVTCAQFRDVTDFVDRIRAANPRVSITGVWPMALPPIAQRRIVEGGSR